MSAKHSTKKTKSKRTIALNRRYDSALLFPTILLVGLGIVMVYSASSALSFKVYGHGYYYLKRQAVFALAGVVALVVCRHFPYRYYRQLAYPMLGLALALLVMLFIPGLGHSAGGSTRWLHLAGYSFQPSEFARLAMVIYLAYSLAKKEPQATQFAIGFVPHVVVLGAMALLIAFEPDFGSVVILTTITWVIMFAGGVRLLHLLTPMPLVVAGLGYFLISAPYRLERLASFLNPWAHATDKGYQVVHSQMAFGTGGWIGTGLGQSYQKLFYLPEPHTDFIFSVIGEEMGLVGVVVILALYGVLLWRGITIARCCKDLFGALIAVGITTALILQVCINMAVTVGLLPPKGLPLPLLSYGGTSLLITMCSMGILMNIGSTLSPSHRS